MTDAVAELLATLDLEALEHNLFRGRSPRSGRSRVFGGQVVGQALVAAIRTVDATRPPHSLHGDFLRPGDPEVPILYEVDRIRDGRSFTTRRVVARQNEQAIFAMSASFHAPEDGFAHQVAMPRVPLPEALPDEAALSCPSSCGRSSSIATSPGRRANRARTSGSAGRGASRTIPRSTVASSPTPPT